MGALTTSAAPADTAAASNKYLTFTLMGESFGVPIEQVREIIEYRPPTLVPMVPEYLRGVLNLRGSVVPVVDLALRFGRDASAVGRRTCIVIVEMVMWDGMASARQVLGVMVDAVNAVQDIPPAAIEPAPSFGTRVRTEYLHGMGKVRERFVLLLNLQKILSDDALQAATHGADPAQDIVDATVHSVRTEFAAAGATA